MDLQHTKKETPLIRFLGGNSMLFSLVVLTLTCLAIFLLSLISPIFTPIGSIITSILTPLLLGVIFYYLFIPLVDWLDNRKVPRFVGATISLVLMLTLIVLMIAYAIPIVINQIVNFSQALPELVNSFVNILKDRFSQAELQVYYRQALDWINSSLTTIIQQGLNTLTSTLQGLSAVVSTVSTTIFTLMTFPIFLFFLLMDGRVFKNQFLQIFPKSFRHDFNKMSQDINIQVGSYIKGRLIVSTLVGIYYFILYSIIGLNYAFVLALLSGLLSLIPYIGSIISLIPTVIIAATKSTFTLVLALVIWMFAQVLDGNILGPMIIGKRLKMHPLTIIIVLLGASNLMGIVGMIIGIPVYAIIRVFVSYFFNRFKTRYNTIFGEDNYDL